MVSRHALGLVLATATASLAYGCGDSGAPLAPTATAESLGSAAAKSTSAKPFSVDKSASHVTFTMEAPVEKIRGKVEDATVGTLFIDVKDLTQTTGSIAVDISGIELFQQQKAEDGTFGEEVKNDTQNQHARQWLEIDGSTPDDVRKKNDNVEFKIKSIESVSEKDVTKMSEPLRKVIVKAKGDFLLHGHVSEKVVELEVTFKYEGDNPTGIHIKTTKAFPAGLAAHDVRPREAFGKLAQKTLEGLSDKVARDAEVEIDLELVPGEGGATTAASASAAPEMSASAMPEDSASAAMSASAAPMESAAPSGSAKPSASAKPALSNVPTPPPIP